MYGKPFEYLIFKVKMFDASAIFSIASTRTLNRV